MPRYLRCHQVVPNLDQEAHACSVCAFALLCRGCTPCQVGLACALLVGSYIIHQRLQPFMTTKPLSSSLKLTPDQVKAALLHKPSVDVGDTQIGRSVTRTRHRSSVSVSSGGSLSPVTEAQDGRPRGRRNVAMLTRAASARSTMAVKALAVAIDFNLLVCACTVAVDLRLALS